MATVANLQSVVKNTSGVKQYFGFLGPHGITLDADEERAIFGTVSDYVRDNPRKQAALERSLLAGDINILASPAPVFEDQTTGYNLVANVDSGVIGSQAPSWE